jgi:hypothetical protein
VKPALSLKPTHAAVRAYYDTLADYAARGVTHEGATETAFSGLLADTAKAVGWTFTPKDRLKVGGGTIFPDGTLRDAYGLRRGFWKAKDTDDDLDAEIQKKIDKKYPLTNIIFEDTRRLTDQQQLADLHAEIYRFKAIRAAPFGGRLIAILPVGLDIWLSCP